MEIYLLIIILILLAVTLFLGVMNAIFLSKLYSQISRESRRTGKVPETSISDSSTVTKQDIIKPFVSPVPEVDISRAHDITEGLRMICNLYSLNSLTISSADGLAIGSWGAESGVADAARFSHLHSLGEKIAEPGISIFEMAYHGSSLIGIIRSDGDIAPEQVSDIENEVVRLFEKWL